MIKKNNLKIETTFLMLILFLGIASAIELNFCCEALKNPDGGPGAWCQDTNDKSQCYDGIKNPATGDLFLAIQSKCSETGYCNLGTCVDTINGECYEGTPKQKCTQDLGGDWRNANDEDIPECHKACCVLGQESLITTQIKCSTLAAQRNVEPIFRTDLQTITECYAITNVNEEGACTFTQNFQNKCVRTTKNDCNLLKASQISSTIFDNYEGTQESLEGINYGTVEFSPGLLCSAPELGVLCGPSEDTTIHNNKVYFLDTCRNRANVYDYDKRDDRLYWTFPVKGEELCDITWNGNTITNADICGNCDFRSIPEFSSDARLGNFVCVTRDCVNDKEFGVRQFREEHGRYPFDGESWCAKNDFGDLTTFELDLFYGVQNTSTRDLLTKNLPGTQYYVLTCHDGEVIQPELCSPPRTEVCAEQTRTFENGVEMLTAVCQANRYELCLAQTTKEACENKEERDCDWVVGYAVQKDTETGKPLVTENITNKDGSITKIPATCVPEIPPATSQNCGSISETCVVEYKIGVIRDRDRLSEDPDFAISHCRKNCYCLPGYKDGDAHKKYEDDKPDWHPKSHAQWIASLQQVCSAVGDCGDKTNYLGQEGSTGPIVPEAGDIFK